MGVPYYFYQVYKKYHRDNKFTLDEHDIASGIINIDAFFFDYNSMIHPIAHSAINKLTDDEKLDKNCIEAGIIKECLVYTRYIVSLIKPTEIYIMIDGVAPIAKIKQQRERRYKSHLFSKYQPTEPVWDSNNITPGTAFMSLLTESLKDLKKQLEDDNICKCMISDSEDPGEGEHKMMKVINSLPTNMSLGIYGLDADLIMLSLLKTPAHKIVLLRDNSFNTKLRESERSFIYVDIPTLYEAVCKEMRSYGVTHLNNTEIITDYIFICFFLGNDFLPHIPSIKVKNNGMQKLLKAYVQSVMYSNTSLINTNLTINWSVFKHFLINCCSFENASPFNISQYKESFEAENFSNDDYTVTFYKNNVINFEKIGFKSRYYTYYGMNVNSACENFLEGLQWVLGYYNNHNHDNWTWLYKYMSSPFFDDLYTYVKNTPLLEKVFSVTKPLPSIKQLYMVLPVLSLKNILREKYSDNYDKFERIIRIDSYELQNIFPKYISVDLIDKEYLWQSKLFFKNVDEKCLDIFL